MKRQNLFRIGFLASVVVVFCPMIWSAPAHSETEVNAEKKQLELNLDTSKFYEEAGKDPAWMRDENYRSSEQHLSTQCQKMSKQIKALQGQPQRKFALQQRYEAECLSR